MRKNTLIPIIYFIGFLSLSPNIAFAYVGPGAGLSAIGTVIALAAGLIAAIIGFLWYPLKRLFSGKNTQDDHTASEESEK